MVSLTNATPTLSTDLLQVNVDNEYDLNDACISFEGVDKIIGKGGTIFL